MNERIRELMIKSGAFDHYEINEGVDGDELPMEKFAEMIIKESAKVADDNFNKGFYPVGNIIKEHFGVEL